MRHSCAGYRDGVNLYLDDLRNAPSGDRQERRNSGSMPRRTMIFKTAGALGLSEQEVALEFTW